MRRSPRAAAWLLVVACSTLLAQPAAGRPEEDPTVEDGAAESASADVAVGPRRLSDEEAGRLVREIRALARKRDAAPLLAAITAVGEVTHEDLHKPLLGLLDHDNVPVALRAADLLGIQEVEKERDREKLVRSVWKSGWSDRTNARRYGVRGRVLRAYARLSGDVVDEAKLREVRKVWQTLIGDPRRDLAPGMVELCRYARESKDKRLCRLLAEEIDTPQATDVNSPSNPPGEWWERRWIMWREYHAEAVEALEVITGQTFKTTADAKAWFQANESRFGFRW